MTHPPSVIENFKTSDIQLWVSETRGRGSSVTGFHLPDAALTAFRYHVPAWKERYGKEED